MFQECRLSFQDVTLIILLVSAIVSLALSFYRPPDDGLGGNGCQSFFLSENLYNLLKSGMHVDHHRLLPSDVEDNCSLHVVDVSPRFPFFSWV